MTINLVRITECFECGSKENEVKLIFTSDRPILCEKCSEITHLLLILEKI